MFYISTDSIPALASPSYIYITLIFIDFGHLEIKNVVIPLAQLSRCSSSQGETLPEGATKGAAAEPKTILVQIGLEISLGQAVISVQDKRLCIADGDVQSVKQSGVGVVEPVFMDKILQRPDIAAVTIAMNHAAFGESGMDKFPDGRLLDVFRRLHLEIEQRVAMLIQGQSCKNLRLFRTSTPFLPTAVPPKYASSNSISPSS